MSANFCFTDLWNAPAFNGVICTLQVLVMMIIMIMMMNDLEWYGDNNEQLDLLISKLVNNLYSAEVSRRIRVQIGTSSLPHEQ